LPEAYGTKQIWLVARDPHSLYAHWDLTTEQQQHQRANAKNHQLLVRLHRDGVDSAAVSEVIVPSDARHCFLQAASSGTSHQAELGFYSHEGTWQTIAISPQATTPHEGPARDETVQFGVVKARTAPASKPGSEPFSWLRLSSPSASEARENLRARAQNENALQQYPDDAAPPERSSGSLRHGTETLQAGMALVRRRLQAALPQFSSPGSDWPASPGHEGLSSPAGGFGPEQKKFWFKVNTELVIYGSTEPDAHVTIGGRPIQLRADGTFSFRFSLPDGHFELPIKAASSQGEERQANLWFSRGTDLHGDVGAHAQDPALKPPAAENAE